MVTPQHRRPLPVSKRRETGSRIIQHSSERFKKVRRAFTPPTDGKRRNLVFVYIPGVHGPDEADRIRDSLEPYADYIDFRSVRFSRLPMPAIGTVLRPTLTVSTLPTRRIIPVRGPFCTGRDLGKHREYLRLREAGLPVVNWLLLEEGDEPDMSAFGDYVVMKPDRGGRGADVLIVKKQRVKWRQTKSDYIQWKTNWIVQDFVYTGPHPVSYRVTTLFGDVIFARRSDSNQKTRPLKSRADLANGDYSRISATQASGHQSLCYDEDIIALGEEAHRAFPDIPALGVDIIRDAETGELFICEVNAIGHVWHLSSPSGRQEQAAHNLDFAAQFDAYKKIGEILARETVERAS